MAGEVVEAGPGVTRLRPGDRVLGMAAGLERSRNRAAEGAFQKYTVLMQSLVSPIPDELSFEQAAVLPLTLSTAATGLFQQDHLALPLPVIDPPDRRQTVLVWGGSTSVGSNGIQLARCAGYRVITTASPRNFGYVRAPAPRQRSTTTAAPPSTRSSRRWATARWPARSRSAPGPSRRPCRSRPKCPAGAASPPPSRS